MLPDRRFWVCSFCNPEILGPPGEHEVAEVRRRPANAAFGSDGPAAGHSGLALSEVKTLGQNPRLAERF